MKSIRNDSDYSQDGDVYLNDNTNISRSGYYRSDDSYANRTNSNYMDLTNDTDRTKRNKNRSIFYEHPLIQREDPRVAREALIKSIPPPPPPPPPPLPPVIPTKSLILHAHDTHPHSYLKHEYVNNALSPTNHSKSLFPLRNHTKEQNRLHNNSRNGSDYYRNNSNNTEIDTGRWSVNDSTDDKDNDHIDTSHNDTNDNIEHYVYLPLISPLKVLILEIHLHVDIYKYYEHIF